VSGVLWATASGIGFGLFQSINRRAIRGIEDPYVSTFLQLFVATAILVVASLASEDLSRLADASGATIAIFALAGIVHFVLGWLLLNVSQARIGASRTAPLITLTPLFGIVLAAVTLGELPRAAALAAIVPIMVGAWLLASRGGGVAIERDSIFAFGTTFMWALSAVLTVKALKGLDSPLLGVTLGLLAATAALGGALLARGSLGAIRSIARNTLALKLFAAVLVAFATWFRLLALGETDVAVVLATNLVAVPITLVLAPLVVGRHLEQADARVWLGGLLVAAGVLALIALEG
jgi:drug/metabolite transporter (DMT)-like permease